MSEPPASPTPAVAVDGRIQRGAALLLLAIAGVISAQAFAPMMEHETLVDDAFITLTYAKNLAAGNGFIYNAGEPTLGTSSPLLALSVGLVGWMVPGADLVDVAVGISILAWLIAGWLLFWLFLQSGLRWLPAAAGAATSMVVVHPWLGSMGMEMPLFECLLLASFVLYRSGRGFTTGVVVALLALTRGEGALVGVLLMAHAMITTRRIPWRLMLGGAIVGFAWMAYGMATFGTWIPSTLAAKQAQGIESAQESFISTLFGRIDVTLRRGAIMENALFNPMVMLAIGGMYAGWRRARWFCVAALSWAGAYLLGYEWIGPRVYPWYELHIMYLLQMLAGLGLALGLVHGFVASGPIMRGGQRVVAVFLGLWIAIPGAMIPYLGEHRSRVPPRAATYRQMADWLVEHSDPSEAIAFHDIGYIGYYTPNPIVDLAGLIDPEILAGVGRDGIIYGVRTREPGWVVLPTSAMGLRGVAPIMDRDYVQRHQVGHFRIFSRRDRAPTGEEEG